MKVVNWFWSLFGWDLFEKRDGDTVLRVWVNARGDVDRTYRNQIWSELFGRGFDLKA